MLVTADETQASLTGAWRLMLGKAEGVRLLNLTADGFWNSFYAIAIAVPALVVGWVGIANEIGEPDAFAQRLAILVRLAMVDLGAWVLPLIGLAVIAPRAGIGDRFVAYVVASNWASAIIAWLMLPAALVRMLLPDGAGIAGFVSLFCFILSIVLTWRMTNTVIGKGVAVGAAVFLGMFVASVAVLFALQALLGITVP